jgi:predicted transglutaminase-like cysteine proteinase
MRNLFTRMAAGAVLVAMGFSQTAEAGFIGLPRGLQATIQRIKFEAPALAPFAYTEFCLHYKNECKVERRRMVFRGGRVRMDYRRWAELAIVNTKVNSSIRPERNEGGLMAEKWLINPKSGDCNDYAVSKRHELIKRGWSARNVLLSEVVTSWGEHHLVVVVRTRQGDLVLDNLAQQVRVWSQTPYQWVRIQRPDSERLWSTIATRDA